MKSMSLITKPHLIPNPKTSVHLKKANEDIFDEIGELSDPAQQRNATDPFKAQNPFKGIVNPKINFLL